MDLFMTALSALALDLSTALFLLIGVACTWVMYRISVGQNKFEFSDLLTTNGYADIHKLSFAMGAVVSTWALFHFAVNFQLSDTFFATYIGAFVLNGAAQKYLTIQAMKEKNKDAEKTSVSLTESDNTTPEQKK